MFYFHSLDGSTVGTRKRLCVFGTFCAVLTVLWLFLTIDTLLVQSWCTSRHMSSVYTESAEYTKPRKRRYLARPLSHVPGQWPQPVVCGQDWLYVSTWTSIRLAPVRCRVRLHSILPTVTDDACCSSSLSTTVIKFSGPHSQTFCSPAQTP